MVRRLNERRSYKAEPRIVSDSRGNLYNALLNEVEKITNLSSKSNIKRVGQYLDKLRDYDSSDETLYDFLFDSVQSLQKLFDYIDTYSGTRPNNV